MKVIIDIPEDWREQESMIRVLVDAARNGTPIPDNAKNIDVLMTVFPKADIKLDVRDNNFYGYIEFAGDWLEAPYKADKGDKKNETN